MSMNIPFILMVLVLAIVTLAYEYKHTFKPK